MVIRCMLNICEKILAISNTKDHKNILVDCKHQNMPVIPKEKPQRLTALFVSCLMTSLTCDLDEEMANYSAN